MVAIAIRAPSTSTAKGNAAPAPAPRRAHGEAQRRAMVGHHHLVRVARGAHSLDMRHGRRAGESHPPARLMGPPTQIHVLGVHEVSLVEAAELLEGRPTGQEARA